MDTMDTEEIREELKNSLDKLLEFAGCDHELKKNFREDIAAYKKLSDKNSTDGHAGATRRKLTKLFYQVYKLVFVNSLKEESVPALVSMFLNFGYVDEELAGMENAVYLYELVRDLPTDPGRGVYSFYQWLLAIYEGWKEPSRNEFDMDFKEYLHEQKRMNKITGQQEAALLQSNISKVSFELENMFPVVNKLTFGQPSIFCPVFSKHNIYRTLSSGLVTADMVVCAIEEIRSKDFKAFYRETLFSVPERGISERIEVEVLPDIILMPNVGGKSIMWQEIEGKKRTTPARMFCSVFHTEELTQSMMHVAGEFRWEMCKRAQGARWNNVADPSLTSEYCDYVQFYRKNKELSADAKEKVKTQLARVRNNYKQMFVTDYLLWLQYESGGLPRLNKVSRNILFTYCPFPAEIRNKIGTNPLYKQAIDKYAVINSRKLHRLTLLCRKLEHSRDGVPKELAEYKKYMES